MSFHLATQNQKSLYRFECVRSSKREARDGGSEKLSNFFLAVKVAHQNIKLDKYVYTRIRTKIYIMPVQ